MTTISSIQQQRQERKQEKREVCRLIYEYNTICDKGNGANFTMNEGRYRLTIEKKEYFDISYEQAVEIIHQATDGIYSSAGKFKAGKKGRGYYYNRMSVNAKIAHHRGLKPKSYFNRGVLNELGFHYSLPFFNWLIHSGYLYPAEWHHTSAAKNMTGFFLPDHIKQCIRTYNLEFLYQQYREAITREDAMKQRGIKFVKIQVLSNFLTGSRSFRLIKMNCILCDQMIVFSPTLCFAAADERVEMLELYDEIPGPDFGNDYFDSIIRTLLEKRVNPYYKYMKQ